jgi:glutamate/tyrosine decarboxylase-like PLP-dependent enzyme
MELERIDALPEAGWRQYEIEQRMHALLSLDPELERGWPDTLWPVIPDHALAVARSAMAQFAHLNGFVKPESLLAMEAELLTMIRSLLDVPEGGATTLTVGGTESNHLAVKGALFRSRAEGRLTAAENIVLAASVHPSFDKAAEEMGVEVRRVPIGPDYRADVAAMGAAIDGGTIGLVGSTPTYTHGVIDPVPALGELAQEHDLWLHIDACVGGFLLPHVRRLGRLPWEVGFAVDGVTSISADLHKLGFTPTGISTLSVRDAELCKYHSFKLPVADGWPFRDYSRVGFSGSRSGAVIAAAWATMMALGADGYLDIAREIFAGADLLAEGFAATGCLQLAAPHECGVIVFESTDPEVPIARVGAALHKCGWPPTYAIHPPRLHMLLSPLPTRCYEAFLVDVEQAVEDVRAGRAVAEMQLIAYGADPVADPAP